MVNWDPSDMPREQDDIPVIKGHTGDRPAMVCVEMLHMLSGVRSQFDSLGSLYPGEGEHPAAIKIGPSPAANGSEVGWPLDANEYTLDFTINATALVNTDLTGDVGASPNYTVDEICAALNATAAFSAQALAQKWIDKDAEQQPAFYVLITSKLAGSTSIIVAANGTANSAHAQLGTAFVAGTHNSDVVDWATALAALATALDTTVVRAKEMAQLAANLVKGAAGDKAQNLY